MENTNSKNPGVGRKFQNKVKDILEKKFNQKFETEVPLQIGTPSQDHKFDLVAKDTKDNKPSVVVECKCYTWTKEGNVPSAKMATLDEAVFYFSFLPSETTKLLCMKKAKHKKKKETLTEHFVRLHGHLLKDVVVCEISDDDIKVIEYNYDYNKNKGEATAVKFKAQQIKHMTMP